MARKRKPLEVERFTHVRAREELVVYYDTEGKHFFGTFAGHRVNGETQNKAHIALYNLVTQMVEIEWIPVIQVSHERDIAFARSNILLAFTFKRYYIGLKADGCHIMLEHWNLMEEHGEDKEQLLGFSKPMYHEMSKVDWHNLPGQWNNEHYIPYTEELWIGLCQLQKAVQELVEKLKSLISTPEGIQRIEGVGLGLMNLLPEQTKE